MAEWAEMAIHINFGEMYVSLILSINGLIKLTIDWMRFKTHQFHHFEWLIGGNCPNFLLGASGERPT